ncbi:hypothetical protein MMAGJ_58800 [Mycolicibacterium mageritense]|uniref:Uncharacterized protein n=1 Tax=Mycolicibacterium mageritense TaxID=53462 RepID=A0ABM7I157_MYCME|nr:hypothetical protein MMAGJ_58800 [Mycolicibacterium mageritense]
MVGVTAHSKHQWSVPSLCVGRVEGWKGSTLRAKNWLRPISKTPGHIDSFIAYIEHWDGVSHGKGGRFHPSTLRGQTGADVARSKQTMTGAERDTQWS